MNKFNLLFVLVIFISGQSTAIAQDAETLTGIVRITTDDTGSEITQMELVVMTEYTDENGELNSLVREYRIITNEIAGELQELDGIMVEVTGQISGDEDHGFQIEIENYSVVEEDDSEESLIDQP